MRVMKGKRLSLGSRAALEIFTVILFVTSTYAATEKVLHNFNDNGTDGYTPFTGLILSPAGYLYGTTAYGGTGSCTVSGSVLGCGIVFELRPKAGGGWTETVVHSFNDNGIDGNTPYSSLTFDAHTGNLYGTTYGGGTYGYGTVFELTPNGVGGWTETVVHNFNDNGTDGYYPFTGLIVDAAGNLYGATFNGGAYGVGTVFELTPSGGGVWTEAVLHNFNDNGTDGYQPYGAGLILDSVGNLYGTTVDGGAYGVGTVFELTPSGGGVWTETILHSFNDTPFTDGYGPTCGLIVDAAGNLYGTTTYGGHHCCGGYGTVFELTPTGAGSWTEKVLHSFEGKDGEQPWAGLVLDASGNLYGTTYEGGAYGVGTVFELSPAVGGSWTETLLHSFHAMGGSNPVAGLIVDAAGNLYGTTAVGGAHGYGTVFEIIP